MQVLQIGSHGPAVRALQQRLRPFAPDLVPDGTFGPRTERAVRLVQRRLSLFPADGLAGPKTLAALDKAVVTGASQGGGWRAIGSAALSRIEDAAKSAEATVAGWVIRY